MSTFSIKPISFGRILNKATIRLLEVKNPPEDRGSLIACWRGVTPAGIQFVFLESNQMKWAKSAYLLMNNTDFEGTKDALIDRFQKQSLGTPPSSIYSQTEERPWFDQP